MPAVHAGCHRGGMRSTIRWVGAAVVSVVVVLASAVGLGLVVLAEVGDRAAGVYHDVTSGGDFQPGSAELRVGQEYRVLSFHALPDPAVCMFRPSPDGAVFTRTFTGSRPRRDSVYRIGQFRVPQTGRFAASCASGVRPAFGESPVDVKVEPVSPPGLPRSVQAGLYLLAIAAGLAGTVFSLIRYAAARRADRQPWTPAWPAPRT